MLCVHFTVCIHTLIFITPKAVWILQNSRQSIGTLLTGTNSSIHQRTQQLDAAKHNLFFIDSLKRFIEVKVWKGPQRSLLCS